MSTERGVHVRTYRSWVVLGLRAHPPPDCSLRHCSADSIPSLKNEDEEAEFVLERLYEGEKRAGIVG